MVNGIILVQLRKKRTEYFLLAYQMNVMINLYLTISMADIYLNNNNDWWQCKITILFYVSKPDSLSSISLEEKTSSIKRIVYT